MKKISRLLITGTLTSFALGTSWLSMAADNGNGVETISPTQTIALESAHGMERRQGRLDELGKRLNIGAGQQDAWLAYRNAAFALRGPQPTRPAPEASASTVVRARAEMAMAQAQKLGQFADATEQLERVLDANQRNTLNQALREHHRRQGYGGGERGVDKAPTT